MKKKILPLLFIISMAFFANPQRLDSRIRWTPPNPSGVQRCKAGINSTLLRYSTSEYQNLTQWCWAACVQMIFRYYGYSVSQTRIMQETWGSVANMPAEPIQILHALNRDWVDDTGKPFRSFADSLPVDPIAASQDLSNNIPLLIETQGHAMVLTALVYDRVPDGDGQVIKAIVRDPWPSRDKKRLRADEWHATTFLARIRVDPPGF